MNRENYKFREIKGNGNLDFIITLHVESHLKNKVIYWFSNYICLKIIPVISRETFLVIIILKVEFYGIHVDTWLKFWALKYVTLWTLCVLFFVTKNKEFKLYSM